MRKKHGFSLIEMVVFIVVMGILATMVVISYRTMFNGVPWIKLQTTYSQAASQCMEWFLGQRSIVAKGFNSIVTGSATPGFCIAAAPNGYNMSASVSDFILNGDTNYKKIDVSLTKQSSGAVVTTLSTIIADY
jgi:prepilin-type N-terminal cleavage/methylation domain-containing protein